MKLAKNGFLLLLSMILLTGCWDSNENTRMFYAHALGIDYKEGEYVVYTQLISFINVAKSDSVNQDNIQSEVNSYTGHTLNEALDKLYNEVDQKVYWGHLSFIIFSEEALKGDRLNNVINATTRFIETRYLTWIYATDDPISDFLTVLPLLKGAITLTRLSDPLNPYESQSFIEPINIRKLIIDLNEPGHEAKIPYVQIEKGWQNQKGSNQSVKQAGVAIITPKTFKGFVKGEQSHGLKWVTDEFFQARITAKYNSEYLSATINHVKTKITPIVEGSKIKFDIDITLTASLASFTGDINAKEVEDAVVKQMKKEIKDTYQAGLDKEVDIYQFSESLYRQDVKAWKKFNTNGKIELSEDSLRNIRVDVQKVDSGRKAFKESID